MIDIAVRAARPIGDGFYGVDIKETDHGFIVMEVNDNPNLEHGIEDQVGKDEIWMRAAQVVHRAVRAVVFSPSLAIPVASAARRRSAPTRNRAHGVRNGIGASGNGGVL